eukprot:m.240419 g.240419  ORF g.240419 m.240419 type:complete len:164 (+) comp15052_c0_seq1:223-714(+)
MPPGKGKNAKKGGNKRRKGKNQTMDKRALQFKEEGQEYAQVVKMLGNGRCECKCFDGQTRIGIICGKMRRRVWVNRDDIVLVGIRDFQNDRCDIMMKYTPDETRSLVKQGQIPDSVTTSLEDGGEEEDAHIVFQEQPASRFADIDAEKDEDEWSTEEEDIDNI